MSRIAGYPVPTIALHLRSSSSALIKPVYVCQIDPNNIRVPLGKSISVTDNNPHAIHKKIRESIYIKRCTDLMNRAESLEISHLWNPLSFLMYRSNAYLDYCVVTLMYHQLILYPHCVVQCEPVRVLKHWTSSFIFFWLTTC